MYNLSDMKETCKHKKSRQTQKLMKCLCLKLIVPIRYASKVWVPIIGMEHWNIAQKIAMMLA